MVQTWNTDSFCSDHVPRLVTCRFDKGVKICKLSRLEIESNFPALLTLNLNQTDK